MRYLIILSLMVMQLLSACKGSRTTAGDNTSPVIKGITTSSKGFSIDCVPTSITVTANITDAVRALLWYRVGADQSYTAVNMEPSTGNKYNATIQALDMAVGKSGTWEFYIAAEDVLGNLSQSPLDTSVQLLLCLG